MYLVWPKLGTEVTVPQFQCSYRRLDPNGQNRPIKKQSKCIEDSQPFMERGDWQGGFNFGTSQATQIHYNVNVLTNPDIKYTYMF